MRRTARRIKLTDGVGYVYWNPDSGEEYALDHPVSSGECEDAENIRHSTRQEDLLRQQGLEWFRLGNALAQFIAQPGMLKLRVNGKMMTREELAKRFYVGIITNKTEK